MTPEQQIKNRYLETHKAQKAQIDAAYLNQKSSYQKQIKDAPGTYQPLRNQAYVNNAMAERGRREQMANMGQSAAGGMSQTLQQRNTNQLLNTVGDATRQQQGYIDNVNLALGNLKTQRSADIASARSQSMAGMNADLLSQNNWQQNFDAQRAAEAQAQQRWQSEYDTGQQRWQQEYETSQKNAAFDQASALYLRGLITAKQFKTMTGVEVKNIASGGGGSRTSASWMTDPAYGTGVTGPNYNTEPAYGTNTARVTPKKTTPTQGFMSGSFAGAY